MPDMTGRRQPLMKYLIRKVGVRKTSAVLEFVIAWEMARNAWMEEHRGEEFTLADYQAYWKVSERTAYRDQAVFREAFDDCWATPTDLLEEARRQRVRSWQKMRWA